VSDSRPLRQIDAVTAQVDQLGAELQSLSTQVMLLLFTSVILSVALGVLLWRR
jgi:hypothetical protein